MFFSKFIGHHWKNQFLAFGNAKRTRAKNIKTIFLFKREGKVSRLLIENGKKDTKIN